MNRAIADLLAGRSADPDTGLRLSVPTKSVVIAASLEGEEARLVKDLGLPPPYAVLSDQHTWEALGRRVEEALESSGPVTAIRLEGRPHPDERTAARVMREGARAGSYIAVGSGTINDLAKFAAARQGKRSAVFATAPSMNGYTSVNASITVNGHKKTLPAVAQEGVFADLGVFARAPAALIRAGFGDAICRSTAEADWYLSHRLIGTPFRTAPFALSAGLEEAMFGNPAALVESDLAALECLTGALILSGFGMTLCGGSAPASQGEHLISHYLEMMAPEGWEAPLHGEQIAVTTLVMARLQEQMLEGPPPLLETARLTRTGFLRHYGAELGAECFAEFAPKHMDTLRSASASARLKEIWPEIQSHLRQRLRPAREIEAALKAAGAPTGYRDLHLSRDAMAAAVWHAREIRNRYTFLDLAACSGALRPDELIGR